MESVVKPSRSTAARRRQGADRLEGSAGLVEAPDAARLVIPQHSRGDVEPDGPGAGRGEPAGTHRGAAADLEDELAGDLAEQVRVSLAQPFG